MGGIAVKICTKCNCVNDSDNIEVCPKCGMEMRWIDKAVYESNQRILAEFYNKQKEEKAKKELLAKYENDFKERRISLDEIIRYRRMLATDEERKRMNQEDTEREQREKEKRQLEQNSKEQFVPKCPTCGSSDIKKISTTAKVIGAGLFGLLSKTAKSQFECKNCGYKW